MEYFKFDFENGVDPRYSSSLHSPSTGEFQDVVVTDERGYSYLAEVVAREFRDKIELNREVTKVQYVDNRYIQVHTRDGTLYRAKYAVISFSSAVLVSNTVQFEPPLPEWKKEALRKPVIGHYCKIFLRFPHQFWDDTNYILLGTETRGSYTHWQNFNRPTLAPNQNILLATLTGEVCRLAQLEPDAKIINDAMRTLRKVYGEDIPKPIGKT